MIHADEDLAGVFLALSDPLRLRLLALLPQAEAPKPICVCDLAKKLGISQPNASHHLKILRSARLIHCRREGGFSYYHVIPESIQDAMVALASRFLHVQISHRVP